MRGRKEIMLAREDQVWTLRIKGYTQARIAAELGIHQGTVSRILTRVSSRVARQMYQQIIQRKAEQVVQLEHIAQEAMDAWERSKEATKAIHKRTTTGEETTIAHVTGQVGDPRFLETAMDALADIRKVLDMEKIPLIGDGGTLVVQQEVNQHYVLVIGGHR